MLISAYAIWKGLHLFASGHSVLKAQFIEEILLSYLNGDRGGVDGEWVEEKQEGRGRRGGRGNCDWYVK